MEDAEPSTVPAPLLSAAWDTPGPGVPHANKSVHKADLFLYTSVLWLLFPFLCFYSTTSMQHIFTHPHATLSILQIPPIYLFVLGLIILL